MDYMAGSGWNVISIKKALLETFRVWFEDETGIFLQYNSNGISYSKGCSYPNITTIEVV